VGYETEIENKSFEASRFGAGEHQIAGCCGARYAFSMEEFNNPTRMNYQKEKNYEGQAAAFAATVNRGVCLLVGGNPAEVKDIKGSLVEHIPCGDELLSIRYCVEQLYDN
jgi:hypothetical protein